MLDIDDNVLIGKAFQLLSDGRPQDALKICLYLAAGDPSLDGGSLGIKLTECYLLLDDLHSAHYWAMRAVEENPALWQDNHMFKELVQMDLEQEVLALTM